MATAPALTPVTVTAFDGARGDWLVTSGGALAVVVTGPDGEPGVPLALTETQTELLLHELEERRKAAA